MTVPYALLGLLNEADRHGYDLKQSDDRRFGASRPLRFGQVYRTLAQLERDGLITVAADEPGAGPERKRYSITPDGVTDLERWVSEPEDPQPQLQTVLFTKVVVVVAALRHVPGGSAPAPPRGDARPHRRPARRLAARQHADRLPALPHRGRPALDRPRGRPPRHARRGDHVRSGPLLAGRGLHKSFGPTPAPPRVATTLVALRPVQMAPLGVRRRVRRRPPNAWRLVPLGAGLLGLYLCADEAGRPHSPEVAFVLRMIVLASIVSVLVGFFPAGAWICMWISRGMARSSRSFTTLIVARRIAADPYSTFRAVGAAAIAIYVATSVGFAVAASEKPANAGGYSVLDAGVVAVHVRGVPEAELASLMTEGVVVAHLGGRTQIIVSCTDLARVTDLDCPLPRYQEGRPGHRITDQHQRLRRRPPVRDDLYLALHSVQPDRLGDHRSARAAAAVRAAACLRRAPRRTAPDRAAGNRGAARGDRPVRRRGGRGADVRADPAERVDPASSEFLIGLGLGTVAAFAVSLIALPFMNAATRHDTVRFE